MQHRGVLILGGGQASAQAAASLRLAGFDGAVTIASEETTPPYQRPPLSKGYLLGELDAERLAAKPPAFYEQNDIALALGARATAIDLTAGEVWFARGARRPFDKLIIATGARARRLKIPGADLAGVMTLRTRNDADALRARLASAKNVVVIGGGYIGLETAAAARKQGCAVTVLEMAPRLLARVAGPELADFYARRHAAEGVDIRVNDSAAQFVGAAQVEAVVTASGDRLPADTVVIGVGVIANTEAAEAAGLRCDDGVVTDAASRTSAPNVYAIGDCARAWSPIYERALRFESVQNALDAAKAASAAILGAKPPAAQTPWNWSDQYDVKLQTAGVSTGGDQVIIRGDLNGPSFAVFTLLEGRLIACDAVNAPTEFLAARQIIMRRGAPDPGHLRDPAIAMKSIMAEACA